MNSESPPPDTLLSAVQRFKNHDALPPHVVHPFASASERSCGLLHDLIQTTNHLTYSLGLYLSMPMSKPKLISLLRQRSTISHSLYLSDQNIHQTIDALRNRSGTSYGEDIPLDQNAIVIWCISRLETWGTSVGMETFKDEGREGGISVVLGGKVLVVDVDFSVDRADPFNPKIDVASVKTSYAIPNSASGSTSTTDGSISFDAFLAGSIRGFCAAVQKDEEERDPREAARLGILILEQLRYLVMLDKLAARNDDGGIRWFVDIDLLCSIVENFARSEAEAVAESLSLTHAPLDIFLLRSHTLPFPYLTSPSISFLVYLSPLSYLSLLRTSLNPTSLQSHTNPPQLDIPLSHLRTHLSSHPKGATIATLSLSTLSDAQLFSPSMSMPTFTARPTFPLVPRGSELDHLFPQTTNMSSSLGTSANESGTSPGQHTWFLDFTDGGKHSGVVMTQSRMRDIELIINPLSGMDHLNSVGMMSFGTGSWVDLLLSPTNPVSPERYTALYRSPTSVHPPLQLRLTAPEEPGFLLDKVRVHSMKEVWGILEVVREQCWLNEILNGCHWTTEGLTMDADELPKESEATEEELQAILNGTLTPRKIPVNVYLPSHNVSTEPLFDTSDLDSMSISQVQPPRPKIIMTSPERPPISGLVEVTVVYDETRPRGISVEVSGAMGADLKLDVLEEICRRGGTMGLSGRIWANAHS